MKDKRLLEMSEFTRKIYIDSHTFYVDQAHNRLLSQFDNMESEAQEVYERWLEDNAHKFDPDRHDPSDFHELADHEGGEYLRLLTEMRKTTILSVIASTYHEWDKKLREWLIRELGFWLDKRTFQDALWKASFPMIMDLLESFELNVRSEPFYRTLNTYRLIINVYKHGNGDALRDLESESPSHVPNLFSRLWRADHSQLKVDESDVTALSEAIIAFWVHIPEVRLESELQGRGEFPRWFEKTIKKKTTP